MTSPKENVAGTRWGNKRSRSSSGKASSSLFPNELEGWVYIIGWPPFLAVRLKIWWRQILVLHWANENIIRPNHATGDRNCIVHQCGNTHNYFRQEVLGKFDVQISFISLSFRGDKLKSVGQ